MSDDVKVALDAAREALRRAEAAARAAGVDVDSEVLEELTVKRINVVEDDGTLRLVIGNSTHGRTVPMRGELIRHPGRHASAGLLFVNDEGTECGGLQFTGSGNEDGRVVQGGYMMFDDYEQNESFRVGMSQESGKSEKFVEFADLPDWSLADLIAETEGLDDAAAEKVYDRYFGDAGGLGRSRMRLAREEDGSVRLVLRDGRGRDRLRFVVPEDGEPVAEVFDPDGVPCSLV